MTDPTISPHDPPAVDDDDGLVARLMYRAAVGSNDADLLHEAAICILRLTDALTTAERAAND